MVYVGILAGGAKNLNNSSVPIQFMKLGEKPVIVHTIEQFLINGVEKKIIVVVPEKHRIFATDLLSKYFDKSLFNVISGGKDKSKSIKKVIEFIKANYEICEGDILINHDAIRPFITQRIINDNIELAKTYDALNTVMPTTDAIIYSENGRFAESIPNTSNVFVEQTPQTFNLKKLEAFLSTISLEAWEKEIDLARLYITNGLEVHLVRGEFSNIKLITEYDLEVAVALVKERR